MLVHFWENKHLRLFFFSWLFMICFSFKLQAACPFADEMKIPIFKVYLKKTDCGVKLYFSTL